MRRGLFGGRQRSAAALETLVCDWADPKPLVERAPWELVLASDVLYERRDVDPLLTTLPRLLAPNGEAWIADPGRPPATEFLTRASERFEVSTRQAREIPQGGIHRLRSRA